jgi:dTDP-4-amino-4,6-dideoxygalactose transaminase
MSAGIDTGVHYPIPLHMQNAYASLGYTSEDFPIATRVANGIISLPMFPHLTAKQQSYIAEQVLAFSSMAVGA